MDHNKMFTKLVLFVVILQTNFVASDRLTDFVTTKLENYPTWLKANNLDPMPFDASSGRRRSSNFFALFYSELRTNYVQGHSNNIEIISLNTSLLHGNFDARYRLNITFYGEHISNGSLFSFIQIEDTPGSWHVNIPDVEYHCSVNFNLLPNGYLRISTATTLTEKFVVGEVYFENVSDNNAIVGYEEYVQEAIINGDIPENLYRLDPLPKYFVKYWEEIIPQTTLEDVYDGPIPTPSRNKFA